MSEILINSDNLKEIIKEGLKEVIYEERYNLYQSIIPPVSKKEMNDIVKRFGNPFDYKKEDFSDKTDWLKK